MLLGWSQAELARKSTVSEPTVKRLEAIDGPLGGRHETGEKIVAALELAGVEFIPENGGGAGVRLKKTAKSVEEITQEIDALQDKIFSMPAPTKPSPEAGMNIMRKAVAKNDLAKLKTHRKRIKNNRSK